LYTRFSPLDSLLPNSPVQESMPLMMISPLDSIGAKPSIKNRPPICRTRTLDNSYTTSFRRLDLKESGGVNGVSEAPHKLKTNKNVRFAEEKGNVYYTFDPIVVKDAEELKEFYVLPDELREIKRVGFLACKEANRTGLAGLLTEIYGQSNERDIQDRLNYWCRMGGACRGLERFANEELSKRRNIFRKRAIVSVLEAQQQLKNEKGIDAANVLRRLSEAYTEQARLFAIRLGEADYHAIEVTAPPPPPPVPISSEPSVAAVVAPDTDRRSGRTSRAEKMKDRAAATAAQQQERQGENGITYRRNNTTMTAAVLQQKHEMQ
jgi:hypothetical protein